MQTVKYRSFSHWFSYHWGWFVLAGVLALLALYFYTGRTVEADPDYRISWVGSTELSETEQDAVCSVMSSLGSDQNGDGEVTVDLVQYIIDFQPDEDTADTALSYSALMKLMADLELKDCYLFLIEDPEAFQRSTGVLQYLDGSIPGEEEDYEAAHWEEMCVAWTCEGLEHTPTYLARRAFFNDESAEELFPGSDTLFEVMTGLGGASQP